MSDQNTCFSLETTLRTDHFVKDMFTNMAINRRQRIIQKINVSILVHSSGQVDSSFLPPAEVDRLEPPEVGPGLQYVDYSEKRSLPITIPDYRHVSEAGEKFVVFNIFMAGRHLCSRRYREFVDLHNCLKREFIGFNFPRLPGKSDGYPYDSLLPNKKSLGRG